MDLENRSRRLNLRIVGLPEGQEGDNVIKYSSKMIKKTFNTEHYENLLILDNAHKIGKKSGLQDKPRHLIVQFHFLQKKENILQAAKKLGMVEYEGCKFRFVPDYSRALLGLRKSFHNVISELFKKQLRPALLYPARLRI